MLISVLMANYNNADYIEEAISSVQKQSYKDWEIILIDDGSTDNSVQIIEEFNEIPNIRIFYNEENKGCGYTKKRCVEEASGVICGFLDTDDILTPEALHIVANNHSEYQNAGLIYSKYLVCDQKLNPLYIPAWIGEFKEGETQLTATRISHFASFKKKIYQLTNGINPNYKRAVDQDLYLKLEEVADTKFIDQVLYHYRKHDQGISTFNNRYRAKYWHLLACFDACERRGINKEVFFVKFLEKHDTLQSLEHSKEYKLGKTLLSPLKSIYSYFIDSS